jgi:beta-glucosidase
VATRLRFDGVLSRPAPGLDVLGGPEHRALAREAAARSVVLLRNQPVGESPLLPLVPGERVAVIGRLAGMVNLGDGGSSDVWDDDCRSVLDGFRDALGDVGHDDGSNLERAAAVAADADVAVVVVGYTHLDEGEYIGPTDPSLGALFPPADDPAEVEAYQAALAARPSWAKPARLATRERGFSVGGDRASLRLLPDDVALVRAVAAANPRAVVVIQAGSAVVVSEWVEAVPCVVQAWYGGCEAGPGLADVLTGRVNPSARLPFSVPAGEGDLPPFDRDATRFRYDRWHGWRHLARTGRQPAFPFGFGLSYTTFVLEGAQAAVGAEAVVVRAAVRNTGGRDGADVVQVYATLPDPDVPARLVGFARVEVPAGGASEVAITVPVGLLATRDPERHTWRAAHGHHQLTVARHAGDHNGITLDVEL